MHGQRLRTGRPPKALAVTAASSLVLWVWLRNVGGSEDFWEQLVSPNQVQGGTGREKEGSRVSGLCCFLRNSRESWPLPVGFVKEGGCAQWGEGAVRKGRTDSRASPFHQHSKQDPTASVPRNSPGKALGNSILSLKSLSWANPSCKPVSGPPVVLSWLAVRKTCFRSWWECWHQEAQLLCIQGGLCGSPVQLTVVDNLEPPVLSAAVGRC